MDERHQRSADEARASIERGDHDPALFREALLRVPMNARDAWLDRVLGLGELPDDGPELPRGCVPYLPCSVDVLLRMIDQAGVHASDVFVDIGSGVGRALALVHLLTGASGMGVEIQPALARVARELASRLALSSIPSIVGDAAQLTGSLTAGTVFFLYCPFGGERLAQLLDRLEPLARTRMLRICCVDLPLPPRAWLTPDPVQLGDLVVYRSSLHPRSA